MQTKTLIRGLACAVAGLLVTAAIRPGAQEARAQSPSEFEVVIPADVPADTRSRLGSLEVRANSQTCVNATLAGTSGELLIRLGTPDQPASCATEGARVTFLNGARQELFVEMTLLKGTRQQLTNFAPKPPTAPPPSVARLSFPITACNPARVLFSWSPVAGALVQWLDLSLFDNGFAPGSFLGGGPITPDPTGGSYSWHGVLPGLPHYWRINTLTAGGWQPSATGAFVPCGGPQLRGVSYTCAGGGRANMTFDWIPPSPPGLQSWLDLSLFDNGFAPSTFVSAGPQHVSIVVGGHLTWAGILTNTQHYWRFNTLFEGGWVPTATGSFLASC